MKKYFAILLLSTFIISAQTESQITYNIDIKNHLDDLFHVTVFPTALSSENNMYHFPMNVPGTYGKENFGRFVKEFRAFDKDGKEISVERSTINSWFISEPASVYKLVYDVEDTYDTKDKSNPVSPMSGSGIDTNFVVLNTHAVAGYFEGKQFEPIKFRVDYKKDWTIGTSLEKGSDDNYLADSYNDLVDNPILIGDLTHDSFKVNEVDVNIYVYSMHPSITAEKLVDMSDEVLKASEEFIGYSPVDSYSFLMCFFDIDYAKSQNFDGFGALEHNTSSLYGMPIFGEPDERMLAMFKETMAHEFFHILTPLNLRSEKISNYNFIEPDASEHLWLYEGVTEWASNIMLLRGGEITLEEYLAMQGRKIEESQEYDQTISLSELSTRIYEPAYSRNFMDFYRRAAIVASLLDIRILELSDGQRGFREVFIELLKEHGEDKPFDEATFFDLLVDKTYPEIADFVNDYIKGIKPLPINEYFSKIGINYYDEHISKDPRPTFGVWIMSRPGRLNYIGKVYEESKQYGYQINDQILEMQGHKIEGRNLRGVFEEIYSSHKLGDDVKVKVQRGKEIIDIEAKLVQRLDFYTFEVNENPTKEQLKLREAWLKNL